MQVYKVFFIFLFYIFYKKLPEEAIIDRYVVSVLYSDGFDINCNFKEKESYFFFESIFKYSLREIVLSLFANKQY